MQLVIGLLMNCGVIVVLTFLSIRTSYVLSFPWRRVLAIVVLTLITCVILPHDPYLGQDGGRSNLPGVLLFVLWMTIIIIAGSIVAEPDPDPPAY